MSHSDDPSIVNFYQFPRWSTSVTRPHSNLPSKNGNDMFNIGMHTRNHHDKLEISSKRNMMRHNSHIPTGLRILSPPPLHQPTPTPDVCSSIDRLSSISSISSPYHIAPVRIQSAALTLPTKSNTEEILLKNFPKQSHERRKIAQERKRRKQQAQKYAESDPDTWFQLRQSLVELKRLASTEEVLVDPSTSLLNCDGYSFEALKQIINEQQENRKINKFKSESGMSSSLDSILSSNNRSRTSLTTCPSSLSRPQTTRQTTETYSRPTFEPLIIAAKPLHPLLLTGNNHPPKTKARQIKAPLSAPSRVRSRLPLLDEKRTQFLLSDLSMNDDPPVSSTPSPPLQKVNEEEENSFDQIIPSESTNRRASSNVSLKSTMKLKSQFPRCRSAVDIKCSFTLNKNYPRFILITDQEHRIESWYHHYPFILSDDLLQLFESKQNHSTISAYFIDDDSSSSISTKLFPTKTYLQGKSFHINNDWKKYDLILISNNIYQEIIIYLQTIINLIKSKGKIIHIYQINHHEDLKTQIKFISKQLNQQISSQI